MPEAIITMDGHILDSLILPKVLDIIIGSGAEYEIEEINIGRTRHDKSTAKVRIVAPDSVQLKGIVEQTVEHGAKEID